MGKDEKEKTGEDKDVYIATCYLNPSKSAAADSKITKLAEEIISFQQKGEIFILGDLNAKTGNIDDGIIPDKTDELFDLVLDDPPPKRNSEDDSVNARGNELLDTCRSLDRNIVNGRKTGDPFGKLTCFKWNGNSVVDYLITSSSVFKNISSFEVGEFLPWLSDHCPLYFTAKMHTPILREEGKKEGARTKAPKQYIWSTKSKEDFLNTLKNTHFQESLMSLIIATQTS